MLVMFVIVFFYVLLKYPRLNELHISKIRIPLELALERYRLQSGWARNARQRTPFVAIAHSV